MTNHSLRLLGAMGAALLTLGTAQAQETAQPDAATQQPAASDTTGEATIATAVTTNPQLSTLASAVSAAGLGETLAGAGPFTVFAPLNEAFTRLAPGTLDTLLKPENKPLLTKVLTYHVVPGAIDAPTLLKQAQDAGGSTTLTTVAGDPITATAQNGAIVLKDVNGNLSYITQYDVKQANGVVHVVNGILLPKQEAETADGN